MASDHDPQGRCATDNPCMACKCRHWRAGGGAPIKFTYGRDAFKGPTGAELGRRERQLFREANGYDPIPRSARAELI